MIDKDLVVEAVRVLSAGPSPRGQERQAAVRLEAWARDRWPAISWRCDPVGPGGANLVATTGQDDADELLFYSHVDTSLSGDPSEDWLATGLAGPIAPLTVDKGLISGFGLGVARAPAAAALVGYATAAAALREAGLPHRLTLLLASAGTHSSPFGTGQETGVEAYLRTHPHPAAAVVAKSGPPGVLYEEPGAMFVRVQITAPYGPVLARDASGGLLARLGVVTGILERWRAEHIAARADPGRQIAAEAGIGAVRGGLLAKPDLLPGVVELHLYVVTVPGDDPASIAGAIQDRLSGFEASVAARLVHPAGLTRPDAPIVGHAVAAWQRVYGEPPAPISGWKGSTDGVVLRGHGIPTVRVGPTGRPDPADQRRDIFPLESLVRCARLYASIALGHAVSSTDRVLHGMMLSRDV